MNNICVTCLSSERHLIQLRNLLVYTNIWRGVSLQMTDYICWECKAMFNNIWRFKQQVLTAQDVLRNQNLTEIPKVNQCLSKLTKSIKTSYDSEYHEDDVIKTEPPEPPSVVYLEETIKKEEHFTDDCSYTEQMKTEFEETEFNNGNDEDDITNETEQPNDSGPQPQLEHNSKVPPFRYMPSTKEKMFIINVMNKDDFLKARETDRELPKYKDSTYKCENCIVPFVNEEKYKNHLNIRHSAEWGGLVCNICKVHFTNNSAHKSHTIRHFLSYQCKVCEFKSHRINEMTAHHSKEHEGAKTFPCSTCNTEFDTARRLKFHHNKEHTKLTTCTICKKQYSSTSTLHSHMLVHKGLQPRVKCEICKKRFINIWAHMNYSHGKLGDSENAYCAKCNIQYKTAARYKLHLKESTKHVSPEKFPYTCAECGKKFLHKNALSYHLAAIHFNKKDFVCKICKKAFVKADRLRSHVLYKHEGVSQPIKHICSYCGKGFTTRALLDNHIRTHTGEKPFECNLCDSKFSQESSLRTHIKGVHKKLFRKIDN